MRDNHKPIEIHNKVNNRIKVDPIYFKLGFSSIPAIYARQMVLECLIEALDILPSHLGFLVWDVYRSRAIQKKLFEWMREQIRTQYPYLNEEENFTETCRYMSPPALVGDEYCPPHLSGGAIDLTIFNLNSGEKLTMGTEFDDCSPMAHSNYFNHQLPLLEPEKIIKKNRQLLKHTMEAVGFTAYDYEWWHYDIGNLFWSRVTMRPAIFGPLFGDKEWPI